MSSNQVTSSEETRSTWQRSRDRIGAVLGAKSRDGYDTVTAANWLTLLRLVLLPFFLWSFLSTGVELRITATVLFLVAALSDMWDGKLARARGQVTPFGNFVDPLADKLMVLSAYWAIVLRENFGAFLVATMVWISLITIREVAITLKRIIAINSGSPMKTEFWGKAKAYIQFVTLVLTLFLLNLRDLFSESLDTPAILFGDSFYMFSSALMFLSAVASVVSGVLYFSGGKRIS